MMIAKNICGHEFKPITNDKMFYLELFCASLTFTCTRALLTRASTSLIGNVSWLMLRADYPQVLVLDLIFIPDMLGGKNNFPVATVSLPITWV